MSENLTPAIHELSPYALKAREAFDQLAQQGFDMEQAIRANYGQDAEAMDVQTRAEQVTDRAATIATDLELDDSFFERSANTILLLSVADSWETSEERIKAGKDHDTKVADERAMLVDTMLMVAGKTSGFARSLAQEGAPDADRYVINPEAENEDAEREAFVNSLNDEELAAKLTHVLQADDANALLHAQREQLGVTPETEQQFDVKVIKMGDKWSLKNAGYFPAVQWPDWEAQLTTDAERQERLEAGKAASAENDRQQQVAAEFENNLKAYQEKFGEKHGELAEAFVNHDERTGKVTMYLRAPEAIALIQHIDGGFAADPSEHSLDRAIHTLRHEYVHTQKEMFIGAQSQLGVLLEERKAELVSHDKLGYQDVKYFISDLSMVNGVRIIDGMAEALKQPDALSAFLLWSSKNLGLRNTLFLMTSKPAPYDKDPYRAAQFPNMASIKHGHDHSIHDAVIRESVEQKGTKVLNEQAAAWAGRVLMGKDAEYAEWLTTSFIPYRERHGVTQLSGHLKEAVDAASQEMISKN